MLSAFYNDPVDRSTSLPPYYTTSVLVRFLGNLNNDVDDGDEGKLSFYCGLFFGVKSNRCLCSFNQCFVRCNYFLTIHKALQNVYIKRLTCCVVTLTLCQEAAKVILFFLIGCTSKFKSIVIEQSLVLIVSLIWFATN